MSDTHLDAWCTSGPSPTLATTAVRASIATDPQHGAVVPPIHLSTNYTFDGLGGRRTFDYTRSGNPTRAQLADALAALEGGAGAVVTASGMAAITAVLHLLEPGARLVIARDCYGGTWRLVDAYARRRQLEVEWADLTDPVAARRALARPAAMVWVETPSNPLLRVTDLAQIRAAAGSALVVVDNTFLSPALQRPLAWGADLVVHSTTKYLNGHSDVVGGAVIAARADLADELAWWSNALGLTGSPFDSFLTLRGLRTLAVRIRQHEENAAAVVQALVRHPQVARVYWPGLPEHPGHDIARAQQSGFGGMVSFELAGGTPAVAAFVARLRLFCLAESLGGVESLVAHPATMTHASMSAEARRIAGIGDALVRLSVGIEDAGDLVADLTAALDAVVDGSGR
jgi:cystathionine gamma-synthase